MEVVPQAQVQESPTQSFRKTGVIYQTSRSMKDVQSQPAPAVQPKHFYPQKKEASTEQIKPSKPTSSANRVKRLQKRSQPG
jgi:hypothetical protein